MFEELSSPVWDEYKRAWGDLMYAWAKYVGVSAKIMHQWGGLLWWWPTSGRVL